MVGLRTHKHRLVRVKYLRNQGQQNALKAIRMFWYKPEGARTSFYQDERDLSMV
ncbi:unnamed protein product [Candidula unifasciata]|uniref:Uncharacterized protein n=1 Tax=Candidula unifasciata TaxID=100452 RepID=A0A8S4A519_9EUPU|nr:unnamed protein product [Candidula unifasciata]